MNITRPHFQRIMDRLSFDRMGIARLDPTDATRVALYAMRLNAVTVWAIEDYFARGCPADTPAQAKLGLALLGAAPGEFHFPDCDCNPRHDLPCPHREAYRQQLLQAARGPIEKTSGVTE